MPDLPDAPFYQDGQAAVTDYAIECLNLAGVGGFTYARYLYVSDDLGEDVDHQAHVNPDGEGIGSISHTVDITGNIVIQLDAANDTLPRAGFILRLRSAYYQIIGKIAPGRTKNQTVRVTLPVKKLVHPVLPELLTSDGQMKTATGTSGVAITSIDINPLSNRSGETFAFAVDTAWGNALPTGVTINSSTGVISGTPSQTGTFLCKIVATATLANKPTRQGVGFIKLVIS